MVNISLTISSYYKNRAYCIYNNNDDKLLCCWIVNRVPSGMGLAGELDTVHPGAIRLRTKASADRCRYAMIPLPASIL